MAASASESTPEPASEELPRTFEGTPAEMLWQDLESGNAPAAAQVVESNIAPAIATGVH